MLFKAAELTLHAAKHCWQSMQVGDCLYTVAGSPQAHLAQGVNNAVVGHCADAVDTVTSCAKHGASSSSVMCLLF